jgi:hypothetical protein
MDGNKRVAFQAMYLFLGLNGSRIDASEQEVVTGMLSLAAGDLHEPSLATWIRDHLQDQQFSTLVRRLRGILPQDVEMEDYHRHLEDKHS